MSPLLTSPQVYKFVEGIIQTLKDANVNISCVNSRVMLTLRGREGKLRLQLEESIQRTVVHRHMPEKTLVIWAGEEAAVGLQ